MEEIELVEDYPANVASMLLKDEIDLGLIPVAATLSLPEWHLSSKFGIASQGPVASVCLFSNCPVEELEFVYLDYQSKTSVNLVRILFKEFWKREVKFLEASNEDFREKINGKTGAVVIGDRALEQRQHSEFIYDLASVWKEYTGLPFVFAGWISNKKLNPDFIERFDLAQLEGISNLDQLISSLHYPAYSLEKYYEENIHFELTPPFLKGMELFLEKLRVGNR